LNENAAALSCAIGPSSRKQSAYSDIIDGIDEEIGSLNAITVPDPARRIDHYVRIGVDGEGTARCCSLNGTAVNDLNIVIRVFSTQCYSSPIYDEWRSVNNRLANHQCGKQHECDSRR
jgi:hypothetical protein